MAKFECRTVLYWTTPQFLDYQLLIKLFLANLGRGESLTTFREKSKLLYP